MIYRIFVESPHTQMMICTGFPTTRHIIPLSCLRLSLSEAISRGSHSGSGLSTVQRTPFNACVTAFVLPTNKTGQQRSESGENEISKEQLASGGATGSQTAPCQGRLIDRHQCYPSVNTAVCRILLEAADRPEPRHLNLQTSAL